MGYLDEDVLYNIVEEKYKTAKGEARNAYSDVLDTICEMPRADVVPRVEVRHGEWIKQTKKTTSSVKGNEVEYHVNFCSECGYEIGSISYHHKFCQNCGARMKNAGWRDDVEAEMKGV